MRSGNDAIVDAASPPRASRAAEALSPPRRSGFTLIELLAAIAILAIIVVAMGRIFADSTNAWRIGVKKIESNCSGRSALDFMSQELSQAIVDDRLSMKLKSNADSHLGKDSDRLYFVALNQVAERRSNTTYRGCMQVRYSVMPSPDGTNTFSLVRHVDEKWNTGAVSCYEDPSWWQSMDGYNASMDNAAVLADNVRNFEVWVYDRQGNPRPDYDSTSDGPPLWIDLYLEVLAEEDAIKASYMTDQDFIERSTHRYQARVYPQNGLGYTPDIEAVPP
jgi:prepilin-type N-terminal cleavage/methylation domain-containing protein